MEEGRGLAGRRGGLKGRREGHQGESESLEVVSL